MTLRVEIADHVARVTIDRPEVLNAIDGPTAAALEATWQRIEADRDIRAVVLTGAGSRAFCAGADMKGTGKTGLQYWAEAPTGGFGGIALRTTLDIPVIARVNGHALGGGFEMVLGCDIVIAADHAGFGLPEPRVGRLPLDGGMVLLQRQVPHRQAMGMMLTGRRVPAAEALAIGLVNEVVPTADLDAAVDRWLAQVLACAPLSLRAIKQTVRRTAQMAAAEAQAARLPALVECLSSEDGEEGVRAFVEKASPGLDGALIAGEAASMHASVLRYLREVARRGSVRKAALHLRVASSAINRQIIKLEEELGTKIFDRLPDGMRLTPAGEVLIRHVRETLHDYDRLVAEIDGIRGIKSGHIRIAALDSLLVDFLPQVLADFARRFPAVTFSVAAASPMEIFAQVASADADIGLAFVNPVGPALQSVVNVPMPVGAVMPAAHPLARREALTFDDLLPYPALLQRDALPAPPFIDDEFSAFRDTVRVRFTSNTIGMVKRLILADQGIGFYTRLAFLPEIDAGELVWVPIASPRLAALSLGLYLPTQRTLSPACNALVGMLVKSLEAL